MSDADRIRAQAQTSAKGYVSSLHDGKPGYVTSFGGMSPAQARWLEDQLTRNTIYRGLIDNAALASHPVVVTEPGGKTMAAKKKAARKRAPKSTGILDATAGMQRDYIPSPTIAERLEKSAAAHNPAPDNTAARRSAEIQANAMFIAAHFLEALGFSDAEISVVMNCGTGEVRDRIVTGGQIAKLNGIAVQSHAERFRSMRENQWATGARVAARAMRERIELVLPAVIRASQNYDDVKIERVLDVVRNVLPEDVVEVSQAAKRYATGNEEAPRAATGAIIGRADEVGRIPTDAGRGKY